MLLSTTQRDFLTHAAKNYQLQMTGEALSYLQSRGIGEGTALTFQLGYVSEPEPGHEHMKGMLSIPYWTRAGCVNIKTRCIEDHDCKDFGHPKYNAPSDSGTYLYNVSAFNTPGDMIAITEGELDAISLDVAGIPAVGVPGDGSWKTQKHWPFCFSHIKKVFIFPDNDAKSGGRNPGMDNARRIRASLPGATVITLPENEDVNACLLNYGADFLREKVGL